jgi:hypothetical protein
MAKDLYHDHVKHALEKDGWEITHDLGQPHTFLNKKKRYILTSTKVGGNNRRIEDI